jgi:epoxyqueuosine reductase QueG
MDPFDVILSNAARFGLNLVAALPVERYDSMAAPAYRAGSIWPECRSIVVLGNGGPNFWWAFEDYAAKHQGWLQRDNPLDDFTREVVENDIVKPLQGTRPRCVTVYPFVSDGPTLNFMQLAKLAGLAGPSIIGVVVNPFFGPWIAFRAALLLDCTLDHPGDAIGFDPCPSCSVRSCIVACPAGAVSYPEGWNIPKCLQHRVEADPGCADRCHARVACVLGPGQRYPDDELAYHQARSLRAMRPYYQKIEIK